MVDCECDYDYDYDYDIVAVAIANILYTWSVLNDDRSGWPPFRGLVSCVSYGTSGRTDFTCQTLHRPAKCILIGVHPAASTVIMTLASVMNIHGPHGTLCTMSHGSKSSYS